MSDTEIFTARDKKLAELRDALMINRLMAMMERLPDDDQALRHDAASRSNWLMNMFVQLHEHGLQDWQRQGVAIHAPGDIQLPAARKKVREAISNILCSEDGNKNARPVFDQNGYVVSYKHPQLAHTLATFYCEMRSIKPFDYGNERALDFFMVALGRLRAFKAAYPAGVDMRRLSLEDYKILRDPTSNVVSVAKVFQHALNTHRTPVLQNKANGYRHLPSRSIAISGIPFLSHKTGGGTVCLVTVNGGLVPLNKIRADLERNIESNKLIAEFPPIPESEIIGYLPGTEALRVDGKKEIDGYKISPDGAAPLLCLDQHILTGLRPVDHARLMELLQQRNNMKLSNLENEADKRELIAVVRNERKLTKVIELTHTRLKDVNADLRTLSAGILADQERATPPNFFMSGGGPGSAKTGAQKMARSLCDGKMALVSLDDFREKSDLYKVLVAAGHHGDDYILIEPFANTLREWTANAALKDQNNLFYDCSGIPYIPSYDKIAEKYKDKGYRTHLFFVDAPLDTAIKRVAERNRYLPWLVTTGKHPLSPRSFVEGAQSIHQDKVCLFAADTEDPQKDHIVAETFWLSDKQVVALQNAQKGERLADHLKTFITERNDSLLRQLGEARKNEPGNSCSDFMSRIPDFSEGNVGYLVYPQDNGRNSVVAIYCAHRFKSFMDKAMLNPNASNVEGLTSPSATLAFLPKADNPWLKKVAAAPKTPPGIS